MPSTYSTDLRIELIANGEKTGTWGTITNDNLGVIIEDAIAGLVTFTTGVQKYPLTAQNGAADQARCAALAIDTSYAGDFEIYVPPVTKLYVFQNTDTTYNATIYCSATLGGISPQVGANGVTVPPGKTVLLRADGTNVFDQFNHVVNNMSFGGNVSVAGTTELLDDLILGGSPGTSGQVVISQGTGSAPIWGTPTTFVAGMIMMWSGTIATIPSGWLLCNGSSGTPDLRDRFIVGATSDDAGVAKTNITGSLTQTGGSKDAIVVSHTHTGSTDSAGSHVHTYVAAQYAGGTGFSQGGSQAVPSLPTGNTGAAGVHTHTFTTASAGSSGTNANLVPYFALAFIMKA